MDEADGVVGFATVAHLADHLELEALFVDPDHRRHGHAMRLMDAVVDRARTRRREARRGHRERPRLRVDDAAGFVLGGTAETLFGPVPRKHLTLD